MFHISFISLTVANRIIIAHARLEVNTILIVMSLHRTPNVYGRDVHVINEPMLHDKFSQAAERRQAAPALP